MAVIINADEIKEGLAGYDPKQAGLLHRKSTKLADKKFEGALKTHQETRVVMMAGGSASGKTEYVSAYLEQEAVIVFDGTMRTFEGAKIKIRKVQKAGKQAEIHLVLPASLGGAFRAFLNRERQFPETEFYGTHAGARKSVLKVAGEYPDIPIRVFVSNVVGPDDSREMVFEEQKFKNRQELIEYLTKSQYTEQEIIKEVILK